MVKVRIEKSPRLSQGDILRDIEYVEHISEISGSIEVSKIVFPLAIILTQDCDLAQDYKFRWSKSKKNSQDKWLLSIIMAPIYNVEHVYIGEHLSEIGMKMNPIDRKKTPGNNLRNNETPRFHYLEFPPTFPIPPSVIDFKHYFSANVAYLKKHKSKHFLCQIGALYREDLSQRFASYLSRVGLP